MARRPQQDAKSEALRKQRVLNPHPEKVSDERFGTDEFFDPRDLVQVKYEMVRLVREDEATVTEAAERFGFSRPTFYEARRALEGEGLAGLVPKPPGPRSAHKLTDEVMNWVEALRERLPDLGSDELADRIEERFGRSVHPRSVERALQRREKKRRRLG